jgi:transporter family protein
MKNLPITIVTPIRASSPVWTLLGAIVIFTEVLTPLQWLGLIITLVAYYVFSLAGKREGISFAKNKWVLFIVLATLIGAGSSLYDKFLTARYDRIALQAWFSVYLVVVLLPVVLIFWYPRRSKLTPFRWHWAIPLIGIFLVIADFLYFYALSYQDSLISLISTLRRGSVITSFFLGALIFKGEKNIRMKGIILIFILLGIAIIMLGS